MACKHVNRRGDVYYIQVKDRGGGKLAYSATRKQTAEVIDRLPEGYEIYEKPENAQVFVRRIKPTRIFPSERVMVENAIRRLAKLEHFIVDVEADSLIVYVTDAEPDASLSIVPAMAPMTAEQAQSMRDYMTSRSRYSKMMRFVLTDENRRTFTAERWCFLGSIDDWFFLPGENTLDELLKKYIPRLGKDSFFELA